MRGLVTARRADEFAAAVDAERVPAEAPAYLHELVSLVSDLRTADVAGPRTAFVTDLRASLLLAAPEALAAPDADAVPGAPPSLGEPTDSRRRRMVSAAAATCLVVGAGVGVAAASQTALPGDALYPVKRAIERVEIASGGAGAGRGEEYLEQAETRLDEVEKLALTRPDEFSTPGLVSRALDDFSESAEDGSQNMVDAYRDGDAEAIDQLRTFADESSRRLDDLMPRLPAETRDDALEVAQDLADIDATARQVCPACSSLAPLELSSAMQDLRDAVDKGLIPTRGPDREDGQPLPTKLGPGEQPPGTDPTVSAPSTLPTLPTLPAPPTPPPLTLPTGPGQQTTGPDNTPNDPGTVTSRPRPPAPTTTSRGPRITDIVPTPPTITPPTLTIPTLSLPTVSLPIPTIIIDPDDPLGDLDDDLLGGR